MRFYAIFSLLAVFLAQGQEKRLHFRVLSDSLSLAGIRAVNLVSEDEAISDSRGFFWLIASEGDVIVMSSLNFEYTRKLIEAEDLQKQIIEITMYPKAIELSEVVINQYAEINALSLGIISKPIKQYTPAERRLSQAGDFKWWHLIGVVGGQLPIDPIINAISGRTDMLKKEVIAERKIILQEKLLRRYDEAYFVDQLKLAPQQIEGFLFFVAENDKIANLVAEGNATKITFALTELASTYKSLKQAETKK